MKSLPYFSQGLILISFLMIGCNNGAPDNVQTAKDSNTARIDSQKTTERAPDSMTVPAPKADADFLVNASSGATMEVELGKLAQTNATNQRVKAFGAMMIRDHGEGGEKLKALAAAGKITLPPGLSNDQQKELETFQKKTGIDFDRAYIGQMVSDHKETIKEFEKEAGKGSDAQIKAFAGNSLAMLRMHLDSADNLKKLQGFNSIKGSPIPN